MYCMFPEVNGLLTELFLNGPRFTHFTVNHCYINIALLSESVRFVYLMAVEFLDWFQWKVC